MVYHRRVDLLRSFAPWFRLEKRLGIGIAVPPSAAEPWISFHPQLLASMEAVDRWLLALSPVLAIMCFINSGELKWMRLAVESESASRAQFHSWYSSSSTARLLNPSTAAPHNEMTRSRHSGDTASALRTTLQLRGVEPYFTHLETAHSRNL